MSHVSGELSGDHSKEYASFQFPKDHYEVLDVSRKASDEEIQDAYRKLLKEGLHEDKIFAMPHGADKDIAKGKLEAAKEAVRVLGNHRLRANYDAENRDPSEPSEAQRNEWNELAKTKIRSAYDYEEMARAINEYNSHFEPLKDRMVMNIETPIIASLAEGDYRISRVRTIDEGTLSENLIPIRLTQFNPGESVKVKRSSGEIDDDWRVVRVYLKDKAQGLVRYAEVHKFIDGKSYTKHMPVRTLYESNPSKR